MSAFFTTPVDRRGFPFLFLRFFLIFLFLGSSAVAQMPSEAPLFTQPPFAEAKDRITGFVDDEQRVTLSRKPSSLGECTIRRWRCLP